MSFSIKAFSLFCGLVILLGSLAACQGEDANSLLLLMNEQNYQVFHVIEGETFAAVLCSKSQSKLDEPLLVIVKNETASKYIVFEPENPIPVSYNSQFFITAGYTNQVSGFIIYDATENTFTTVSSAVETPAAWYINGYEFFVYPFMGDVLLFDLRAKTYQEVDPNYEFTTYDSKQDTISFNETSSELIEKYTKILLGE